jgi:hypothetical protein
MSLRNRANELNERHKNNQADGVVTLAEQLKYPIDGLVDGQPVRISMLANVTGFSTCYLCTDANGITTWVGLQDVRITERNYQPFTQQQGQDAPTSGKQLTTSAR